LHGFSYYKNYLSFVWSAYESERLFLYPKKEVQKMLREYKVNITETVMRHIWVVADDPQDAIDIAEQSYSQDETLDVSFDCDPTEWRK